MRRLTCNNSMAYLKNWTDNFFQMFFMGTSWVAVSSEQRNDVTKNIKILDFNGVNVARQWHVAGRGICHLWLKHTHHNISLCPARYDRWDIMFPGCPSVRPSVRHVWGVPLCMQRPAKTMHFQPIIMHALQYQHDLDVHLPFCVDLDLHITSSRGRV